METTKYKRNPLLVEAVRVTDENLYEVAKWCGGDVHTLVGSGGKYIQVAILYPPHKSDPQYAKQTRANVGDWILKSAKGYKIWSNEAFKKGFVEVDGPNTELDILPTEE